MGGLRLVVLTGAGISAESGLSTFRDPGGVWDRVDLSEVATPEGFARDPARVHAFYNARRAQARAAQPNAAHRALAALSGSGSGVGSEAGSVALTLVTQNVDDLHARAGHGDVIAMHGRLSRALCAACGHGWDAPDEMSPATRCPACTAAAARPDVVWFGEVPRRMDEIEAALAAADLFVAIGTSGSVWPAAGFVRQARAAGARTLEMNLAPSEISADFHECRQGRATDLVPAWAAALRAGVREA